MISLRSAHRFGYPGTGELVGCELPDMGAGNQTCILCERIRILNPGATSLALVNGFLIN